MADVQVGADVKAAFGVALTLAVVACLIDSGPLGWLLGPIVFLLLVYCLVRAPLRTSLLTLMFFAFTLENPSEGFGNGQYTSPIYMIGRLMLMHLKETLGGGLFFSGMDLMLATLGVVVFMRNMSKSRIDRAGAFATPRPLIRLAHLSLIGLLWVWVSGIVKGGNTSMALWQVDRVFYLPVIFLLFSVGLRGPTDSVAIGKVVLAAAAVRSALAVYIQYGDARPIDPTTGERSPLEYATTHNDSMLFAWATVMLGALLIQRVGKKAVWVVVLLLPLFVAGMIANDRRMVWVQIILVFATMYFATPMNVVKRKIQKAVLYTSPLLIGYIAAGWSSSAGIFAPVKTIRSSVDSEADASTQWRDIENYNLVLSYRAHPVIGTGYGHGFHEYLPLPEVPYLLERYIPHNSILGLWTYCGYVGFTVMTLLWVAGVYFAMRAYHASKVPLDKAAALASFGAVPIYFLQCYGDMGLGSWPGVFMMASSIALAGKLAVASGAWSAAPSKRPAGAQAAKRGGSPAAASAAPRASAAS